jgi:serine/threonine protein kinase
MEFASNGDLSVKIAKHIQQGSQFPEATIWNIFIQLVRGLKQLHDMKVLHRDIKVHPKKRRLLTSFSMTMILPNWEI